MYSVRVKKIILLVRVEGYIFWAGFKAYIRAGIWKFISERRILLLFQFITYLGLDWREGVVVWFWLRGAVISFWLGGGGLNWCYRMNFNLDGENGNSFLDWIRIMYVGARWG